MNKDLVALKVFPAVLEQRSPGITALQFSEKNPEINAWVTTISTVTSTVISTQTISTNIDKAKAEAVAWFSYMKSCSFDSSGILDGLDSFVSSVPKEIGADKYLIFIDKINDKIKKYNVDRRDDPGLHCEPPSYKSLYELMKFLPEMYSRQFEVYVDGDSGSFGVSFSKRNVRFNVLMKENHEVLFSLVKKATGLVKISGRGFFSSIEDSAEINKLIRMIDGE